MRIQPKRQTRENEAKTAYVLVSAGFCRMTTEAPGVGRIRQERILRTVAAVRGRGYQGELSARVSELTGESEAVIDEVMAVAADAGQRMLATARTALKGAADEIGRTYADTMAEAREVA